MAKSPLAEKEPITSHGGEPLLSQTLSPCVLTDSDRAKAIREREKEQLRKRVEEIQTRAAKKTKNRRS